MPAERYFIHSSFELGQTVSLLEQEFHHLAHVMRAQQGDLIELINGQGTLAEAVVKRIAKHEAHLEIKGVIQHSRPSFNLILAQGIPRLNRLDTILEKATELGASQILLIPTETSERKSLTENQFERLQSVTIAAMKQCGRLYLPDLTLFKSFEEWIPPSYPLFFGDLDPKALPFAKEWATHLPAKGAIFFTGPESGLSSNEIAHLRHLGGIGVRLHDNILRTDTASIIALGLMAHWIPTNSDNHKTTPL